MALVPGHILLQPRAPLLAGAVGISLDVASLTDPAGASKDIILDPGTPLVSTQWYAVAFPPAIVMDAEGNNNEALSAGSVCFRVIDTTPPYITAYVPELGATGVSMDPATSFMRLTFNEPVDMGTSTIVLTPQSGSGMDVGVLPLEMQVEGSDGRTLRVELPWGAMDEATTYQACSGRVIRGNTVPIAKC